MHQPSRLLIHGAPLGHLWAGVPSKSLGPNSPRRGQVRTPGWEHAQGRENFSKSLGPLALVLLPGLRLMRPGGERHGMPGDVVPLDTDGSPTWSFSFTHTFGTHRVSLVIKGAGDRVPIRGM